MQGPVVIASVRRKADREFAVLVDDVIKRDRYARIFFAGVPRFVLGIEAESDRDLMAGIPVVERIDPEDIVVGRRLTRPYAESWHFDLQVYRKRRANPRAGYING
jgi:hypothetical protein